MWNDTMIAMLRVMIQDYSGSEFTDSRLEQIIVVSAQLVTTELTFNTNYQIDVVDPDITPDPTTPVIDKEFVNLVVIKSACMIDRGSMRIAALSSGLEARLGPALMQTMGRMDGYRTLIDKGFCGTYEELKKQHIFGNAKWCKAILSPFINENMLNYLDSNLSNNLRGYSNG